MNVIHERAYSSMGHAQMLQVPPPDAGPPVSEVTLPAPDSGHVATHMHNRVAHPTQKFDDHALNLDSASMQHVVKQDQSRGSLVPPPPHQEDSQLHSKGDEVAMFGAFGGQKRAAEVCTLACMRWSATVASASGSSACH
jgi:hypothetical protein